ncbi:MAG: TOTE conflict system archaeo-eukaryotic primase domain-containing protein [Solirubrobacterales bacterium]
MALARYLADLFDIELPEPTPEESLKQFEMFRAFKLERAKRRKSYIPDYADLVYDYRLDTNNAKMPELGDMLIECPLCKQRFKRLTANHLKQHNLTVDDYTKQGNTTFRRRVINKMKNLFQPNPYKWREQQDNGSYFQNETNKIIETCDTTSIIRQQVDMALIGQHLSGSRTISVFPAHDDFSTFMVFDVDENKTEDVLTIIDALEYFVPRNQIYVFYSGRKGYHVYLFFNGVVTLGKIARCGKTVLSLAGLSERRIEILPRPGQQAVKLPLGGNRVTNQFCSMLDNEDLSCLPNPYHSFLAIQRVSPLVLDAIKETEISVMVEMDKWQEPVSVVEIDKPTKQPVPIKRYEHILKYGLDEPGTRHDECFKLALYLKDVEGLSKQEAAGILERWTIEQYENGLVGGGLKSALYDLEQILKSVFDTDKYHLGSFKRERISFSKDELELVKSFKSEHHRLVFMALMVQYKIYGNRKGVFTAGVRQLADLSGINKNRIGTYLRTLNRRGFIEIIEKGKWVNGEGIATKFRLDYSDKMPEKSNSRRFEINVESIEKVSGLVEQMNEFFNACAA